MREILFRGKDIDGKWIEGYYIVDEMDENKAYIGYIFGSDGRQPHDTDIAMVDKSTVCQYTGLTDKNGRKIFEGDIVLFTDNVKIKGTTSHTSKVEWNTELGGFVFHAECIGYYNVNPSQIEKYEVEVIDNIFDNPELLEVENEQ